ncbi:FadR/GntR family transcriptional regulator [Pseudonocardia nigra]|uniref:FadR/GntR family transcriptional regulator n=1 Tax=Pseudonocardia nigra TaxID=1921578 RepID=UPI001C5F9080|nr:FCD domain-containing protein [Pseudonocardia nigra]
MPGLRHGPVVPQVERLLRDLVRAGRWHVGDRLPNEVDLAKELGVGRSTVREAVRLLARDGVLDVRHGSGTFVADAAAARADFATMLRRARLREVYEVRRALEVEAARLAARRVRPEDIHVLRETLSRRQALAAGDPTTFVDADLRFHRAIVELAGNPVLADLFTSVLPVIREALVELERHETQRPDTSDAHENLLTALERGDVEGAIAATIENLQGVMDLVEAEEGER